MATEISTTQTNDATNDSAATTPAPTLIPDLTSIPACDKIATKHACTFSPISGYLDAGGELNEDWRYKIVYISDSPGMDLGDSGGDKSNQIHPPIKIRTGVLSPRTPRAFTLAHEGKIHRLVSNGVDPNIAKASLQVKYGQEFDVCYLANRILHHPDLLLVWTYLADRMLRDNRLYTRACLAYLNIDIGGMSDLRCLSAIEIAFKVFKTMPNMLAIATTPDVNPLDPVEKVIQSGRRIADLIGRR